MASIIMKMINEKGNEIIEWYSDSNEEKPIYWKYVLIIEEYMNKVV